MKILRGKIVYYISCVEDCISERECKKFEGGLKLNWAHIKHLATCME